MTEQEKMKQGYLWLDDDENMDLQAQARGLMRRLLRVSVSTFLAERFSA